MLSRVLVEDEGLLCALCDLLELGHLCGRVPAFLHGVLCIRSTSSVATTAHAGRGWHWRAGTLRAHRSQRARVALTLSCGSPCASGAGSRPSGSLCSPRARLSSSWPSWSTGTIVFALPLFVARAPFVLLATADFWGPRHQLREAGGFGALQPQVRRASVPMAAKERGLSAENYRLTPGCGARPPRRSARPTEPARARVACAATAPRVRRPPTPREPTCWPVRRRNK